MTDSRTAKHVIVGAGTAAFNAVTTLLELAPRSDVTLVSPEPPYARMVLPYYLSSEIDEANVYTIAPGRLSELGVRMLIGKRATGLDRERKQVLLQSGEAIDYDDLLIATGSSAVRPQVPGIDGAGVYDHWTLTDTQALRAKIRADAEVAIVGAGFIAFTIVNPLLHVGCRLTLVEREASVLPRMLNREGASLLEGWLRERGVQIFTGAELQRIEDVGGRKRLMLPGSNVDADVVIVAAGIAPNVEWLRESGLAMDRGLLVDEQLRTNDPSIYAAGDVAEVADAISGQRALVAIETAAMEQGRVVGAAMAGQRKTYSGSMLMNVVEVAGLQAASFGNWSGDSFTDGRAAGGHYRRYVWQGDRLIGGIMVGPARQLAGENEMGMLKGLIQNGRPIGVWKELLARRPFELKKVFVATGAVGQLLAQA